MKYHPTLLVLCTGISILALGACATRAPIVAKIDYTKQVKPIFESYCYQCHGSGRIRGGVRLSAKAEAMRFLKPGDPVHSDVYRAITRDSGMSDHMPPIAQDQPGEKDIATIKLWIEQGANWPDGS